MRTAHAALHSIVSFSRALPFHTLVVFFLEREGRGGVWESVASTNLPENKLPLKHEGRSGIDSGPGRMGARGEGEGGALALIRTRKGKFDLVPPPACLLFSGDRISKRVVLSISGAIEIHIDI